MLFYDFLYDDTHPSTADISPQNNDIPQIEYHRTGYYASTNVWTNSVGTVPFAHPIRMDYPHAGALRATTPGHTRVVGHLDCEDVCKWEGVTDPCEMEKCVLLKHNHECIAPVHFAH